MSTDVGTKIQTCLPCQRRQSSHRPPRLPVGHRPVARAFQRVAVELVEYQIVSEGNRFLLSVVDHLTQHAILIAIKDKVFRTIIYTSTERGVLRWRCTVSFFRLLSLGPEDIHYPKN